MSMMIANDLIAELLLFMADHQLLLEKLFEAQSPSNEDDN